MPTISSPSFSIDLPDDLEIEDEEDGTTLAYYRGTDIANLRISSLKMTSENARPDEGARFIEERATERNVLVTRMDDKVVMQEQDEREGIGAPLVISKWIIGFHQTVIVITLAMDASELDSSLTKKMLDFIPDIIESIRA